MGMGVAVCSSHCLCWSFLLRGRAPQTLFLLQHGVPPTGDSSPWTVLMWVLPMGCSSSQIVPAWAFPMGWSPSGTGCCSMGSQVLPANLLQCGLLSPLVYRSWQKPAPAWVLHSLLWTQPPALPWGPFHGLQMEICFTVDLHGLQGDSLCHHGLLHGLQGNLCTSAWSTSSPSFCTDHGVCRIVLYILTHLSWCKLLLYRVFCLLMYVITEALPVLLMGSDLTSDSSVSEPSDTGSVRHRGSLCQLLTEATPVALPLSKPYHANSIHTENLIWNPR